MQGKKTVTDKQIAEALEVTGGMIAPVARKFNMARRSIVRRVQKSEKLQDLLDDVRETVLDKAQLVVIKKINENNLEAAKFYLTRLGSDRGFGDKKFVDANVSVNKIEDIPSFAEWSAQESVSEEEYLADLERRKNESSAN